MSLRAQASNALSCRPGSRAPPRALRFAAPFRQKHGADIVAVHSDAGSVTNDGCPRTVRCQASSSAGGSHAGHAFLHDFCMAIPYGVIALVAAALLAVLGAKQVAVPVAAGGAVVAAAAGLSLKTWQSQQQSTPFTLVSAGASGYLGYTCWNAMQAGVVAWLNGIVLVLSAALSLFCIYNVLAGGNPPKRK